MVAVLRRQIQQQCSFSIVQLGLAHQTPRLIQTHTGCSCLRHAAAPTCPPFCPPPRWVQAVKQLVGACSFTWSLVYENAPDHEDLGAVPHAFVDSTDGRVYATQLVCRITQKFVVGRVDSWDSVHTGMLFAGERRRGRVVVSECASRVAIMATLHFLSLTSGLCHAPVANVPTLTLTVDCF